MNVMRKKINTLLFVFGLCWIALMFILSYKTYFICNGLCRSWFCNCSFSNIFTIIFIYGFPAWVLFAILFFQDFFKEAFRKYCIFLWAALPFTGRWKKSLNAFSSKQEY